MSKSFYFLLLISVLIFSCQDSPSEDTSNYSSISTYTPVKLTTDLSLLNEAERKMLPHLFAAADIMNDLFWVQAYGDKKTLLASIASPQLRKFAEINYGPWDRLNDNAPFLDNVELKPLGSNFYPADMSKEEFEELGLLDEKGLY